MTDKKTKPNHSLQARAFLLCLLTFFTYVMVPAMAADSAASDPPAKDGTTRQALPATPPPGAPPLKLFPPPPAESPSSIPGTPPTLSPLSGAVSSPEPSQEERMPGIMDSSYILGPGDVILVSDYSSSDTPQPITQPPNPILPDGTISIHPVGIVKVAGMTLGQLTERVNKLSERFIIKPDIEISVIKVRPNVVYILGEVQKPGLYTNESGTLSGAENVVAPLANLSVVSALQKAGGIKESADVRNILVTRLGLKEPLKCNLWQLMVGGDASQDLGLLSGDVIYVPKGGADYDPDTLGMASNQRRKVRVWGAVKQPGLLEMDSSDDILSAISKAGGFTPTATRRWILLSRINRDGTITTQKISMSRGIKDPDSIARTKLRPGDLITVHDSLLKKGAGTAYQAGVYFVYALGLITYSIFLANAVQNNGSSSSSTSTIPVTAPISGTSTGTSP